MFQIPKNLAIWLLILGVSSLLVTGGLLASDPVELGRLTASDSVNTDRLGYSADIDGDLAVVGAFSEVQSGTQGPGTAYIYRRDISGNWVQEAKIQASDGTNKNDFGQAVAVDDGVVLVGAFRQPKNNTPTGGAAYVYELINGVWTETAKLTASNVIVSGQFGRSVEMSNGLALVGAKSSSDGMVGGGAVYVFEKQAGAWVETAILMASDRANGDDFGEKISADALGIVVGAPASDHAGTSSGSAYVFEQIAPSTWVQSAKLMAPDATAYARFGFDVTISGGLIVVGAATDSTLLGTETGSAYVFEHSYGQWNFSRQLLGNDLATSDLFGASVSTNGAAIAIGAYGSDDNGSNSGAVYLFTNDGLDWHQTAKLVPSSLVAYDLLGFSVETSEDFLIAGLGKSAGFGAAYVFGDLLSTDFNFTISPGNYTGTWGLIDNATNSLLFNGTGSQAIELLPGIYRLAVGESQVPIEVTPSGEIMSTNTIAFMNNSEGIDFNTTTITIDPDLYTGPWSVRRGVHDGSSGGEQTVVVVSGLNYDLGVGEGVIGFQVDATGFVNESSASVIGGPHLLTLLNRVLHVDAQNYAGTWGLTRGIFNSTGGNASIILVPGVRYGMGIGTSGGFLFDFHWDGYVSVPNGVSADGALMTLTFFTEYVSVDPGAYMGIWNVQGVLMDNGVSSMFIVPGVDYMINNGASQAFSVTTPCATDPSEFVLNSYEFMIFCGPPDVDEDGVPDQTDNCPNTPNPDQIDQDLDGAGNLCDSDLDGDSVDNLIDNCLDLENAGQEDLDGDGVGDACDDDADGDSVNNAFDNCPDIANPDQADNDLDQSGDVCDADDDNDFVLDDLDNCPLDHNTGQEDYDMNGQGDICDGDVDGDGVLNEQDLCELSPQSLPTNMEGCTGAQFIVFQCQATNYVQHGQYVSCVAHAANECVLQGLILPNEKARFVREAARSK